MLETWNADVFAERAQADLTKTKINNLVFIIICDFEL